MNSTGRGFVGTEPNRPTTQGEAFRSELENTLSQLRGRLENLRERIDPILRSAVPKGETASKLSEAPVLSQVNTHSQNMISQAHAMIDMVDDLMGRIDV